MSSLDDIKKSLLAAAFRKKNAQNPSPQNTAQNVTIPTVSFRKFITANPSNLIC